MKYERGVRDEQEKIDEVNDKFSEYFHKLIYNQPKPEYEEEGTFLDRENQVLTV